MNDDMNGQIDENEELNEEEQQQEEQVGKDSNGSPKSPSGLRGLKGKAKTKITTKLMQGTKVVFKIIAAMPLPVKIALLLVILIFIIFIILELGDETDKTAKAATSEVNSYVSSSDSKLTDEQKEYYEENASLIKFPLSVINEIYNNFNTSDNYTTKMKKGFNYVLGTRVIDASTVATSGDNSITQGNGTWDQGGLENVKMEVPGDEKNFKVTFYTDLPTSEDQSTRLTSTGSALQFGMIASNSLDIGTKVLLEGHGVFTVNDSGLDGLGNSDNEIAIFVPQKSDESSDDYKKRVEGYNEQTIKGKVITVDDYSEYIYSNTTTSATSGYEWDLGGLQQYDYDSLEGIEVEFEVTFYCGTNTSNEGGKKGAHENLLVWGNIASNYWSGLFYLGGNKWSNSGSGRKLGTKIYLKGVGTFTIEDRGGDEFNNKNRIDIFIPKKDGETNSQWENRTNSYGRIKIKGKVLPESYDAHQHEI